MSARLFRHAPLRRRGGGYAALAVSRPDPANSRGLHEGASLASPVHPLPSSQLSRLV